MPMSSAGLVLSLFGTPCGFNCKSLAIGRLVWAFKGKYENVYFHFTYKKECWLCFLESPLHFRTILPTSFVYRSCTLAP
jgi:hypothetical protein